jgi:hypothetical protein
MSILNSNLFSERFKFGVLILTILAVGGLFFSMFCFLLYKLQWWFILLMLGFFSWIAFSNWLDKRNKGKVMRIVSGCVSAPIILCFFLMAITQPFITIIGSYFFVFLFAFGFPAFVLIGITHFCGLEMLPETIAFFVMAGGAIICTNFYSLTQGMIKRTPLRNMGKHRYESYREKLAFYVIHPSNVIFLLYLFYFIFLLLTGFMQIQYNEALLPGAFDAAVLKAFLVFIAFTNMRTKAEDTELDSKVLLKQTMGLFVFDK